MRAIRHIVLIAVLLMMGVGQYVCAQVASDAGMPPSADSATTPAAALPEQPNDTLYTAILHEVYCYAPIKFKNKQQERFYWRTVRDVKKTLPYAKRISKAVVEAEDTLAKMTPKEQRKWWRKREKELFREYEKDFRSMTASQGRMLMLLLDRESDRTSYELIRMFKNKFVADFWQFIAKLFKNDLKEEYDPVEKDRIVERIITLVEAEQL